MEQYEEAVNYLSQALSRNKSYRREIKQEPALASLTDYGPFIELMDREQQLEESE